MASVFISYKREDHVRVEALAGFLRDLGVKDVWTDASLNGGDDWHDVVVAKATGAACVLVCWSYACATSPWVLEEMEIGRRRGVLMLVKFDHSPLPEQVVHLHAPDLSLWPISGSETGIRQLADGVGKLIGQPVGSWLEERSEGTNPAAVNKLRSLLVARARNREPPISYEIAYQQVADSISRDREPRCAHCMARWM